MYNTSHEIVPEVKKDSVIAVAIAHLSLSIDFRVLVLLKVNHDKKVYQSSFTDESGM